MSTKLITNRKEVWKGDKKEDFSIATYNILADFHIPVRCDDDLPDDALYKFCEAEHLYKAKLGKSSKRHLLLMEELQSISSDVICFQEVDNWYYDEVFKAELENLGYHVTFALKEKGTLEGVLTAVHKDKFAMEASSVYSLNDLMYKEATSLGTSNASVRHLERDSVGLLTVLRHLATGNKLIVCNFHAFYEFTSPDIATLQTCLLAKTAGKYRNKMNVEDSSLKAGPPVIYCGDFNTEPTHYGYKVVVNGQLTSDEIERLKRTSYIINENTGMSEEKEKDCRSDSAAFIFNNSFAHELKLWSAYKEVQGHEPASTSNDGKHGGTLDYIFYSEGVTPCAVLATVTPEEYSPGGPSKHFPSDHLMLKAKFRFS